MTLRDALAGTSSTILYWLSVCTVMMGTMVWRQRQRIWHFRHTAPRERADLALNLGMFMFLFAAVGNRIRLLLTFLTDDHTLYPETTILVQLQIPFSFCACLLFIWWCLYEMTERNAMWWWIHVIIGALVALCMAVISATVDFA